MSITQLVELCEKRDQLAAQLNAVQDEMDKLYDTLEMPTLYEGKRLFFFQRESWHGKQTSEIYPSEHAALVALRDNVIQWKD